VLFRSTYSDLKDGIVINDGTSTNDYVITSLEVFKSDTLPENYYTKLRTGDTAAITFSDKYQSLSGSHFFGGNEQVVLKDEDTYINPLHSYLYINGTTVVKTTVVEPRVLATSPTYYYDSFLTSSDSATITSTSVGGMLFIYNGYVYYNKSGSVLGIFRRSYIAPNTYGGEEVVNSVGYSWVWDKGTKCYGLDTTNKKIITYDVSTNTLTDVVYSWGSGAEPTGVNAWMQYQDGLLYVSGNVQGSKNTAFYDIKVFDPVTGGSPYTGSIVSAATNDYNSGFFSFSYNNDTYLFLSTGYAWHQSSGCSTSYYAGSRFYLYKITADNVSKSFSVSTVWSTAQQTDSRSDTSALRAYQVTRRQNNTFLFSENYLLILNISASTLQFLDLSTYTLTSASSNKIVRGASLFLEYKDENAKYGESHLRVVGIEIN